MSVANGRNAKTEGKKMSNQELFGMINWNNRTSETKMVGTVKTQSQGCGVTLRVIGGETVEGTALEVYRAMVWMFAGQFPIK